MKSVRGTQTEKNLLAAFAGESQARNRYTYFASKRPAKSAWATTRLVVGVGGKGRGRQHPHHTAEEYHSELLHKSLSSTFSNVRLQVGFAISVESADFGASQRPAEKFKFIERPAEVADKERSGVRFRWRIPVPQQDRSGCRHKPRRTGSLDNGGAGGSISERSPLKPKGPNTRRGDDNAGGQGQYCRRFPLSRGES